MGNLMSLSSIFKIYGAGDNKVEALADINFSVTRGDYIGIMGQSGSGKSTLLSIMGGMNPPTRGKLLVDGIDVYQLSSEKQADFRREYLGFIFQQLQLVPYLTALENVMLPLVITDLKNHEELALNLLSRVGLEGKSNRLPSELSGGEQGRVAVARAVVNKAPILLADEPTGSLDSQTGQEILELFKELHSDGQTIIMVTHNPKAVAGVDRLIQIKDGRIVDNITKSTATINK